MNRIIKKFIEKQFGIKNKFGLKGYWGIVCRDKITKEIKWKEYIFNLITYEGLDDVLDVYFSGGTAFANHYIFLYESNSTPASSWIYTEGGTGGTSWDEFTDYDEAARPTWQEAGVSSRQITNSANPASFTASTGVNTTIYGSGMVNISTKGDGASGSGKLFCATRFGTARPFQETEEINIVYSITAQSV
jgi:hypothetical protein